jgi:hypothetical protein
VHCPLQAESTAPWFSHLLVSASLLGLWNQPAFVFFFDHLSCKCAFAATTGLHVLLSSCFTPATPVHHLIAPVAATAATLLLLTSTNHYQVCENYYKKLL